MVPESQNHVRASLFSVFRWRQNQRDVLINELAGIESSITRIDDQIKRVTQERKGLLHVIRSQRRGKLSMEDLLDQHRYDAHLEEAKNGLKFEREKLLDQSRNCRRRLLDADLELKKIEKLLERQQTREDKQSSLSEQKMIDDFAGRAFFKPRSVSQ